MKLEEATKYASLFAECDETDQSYIDNNDTIGMMVACAEEAAECSAAIGKWIRTQGIGPITPVTEDEAIEDVKEELADVVSTGILLMHKMGWIEECLDRHKSKSIKCDNRIKEKGSIQRRVSTETGTSKKLPTIVEDYGIKYCEDDSYVYMIFTLKGSTVKIFAIIEGSKCKDKDKFVYVIKYDRGRADYMMPVNIDIELENVEDFKYAMHILVEPKLTAEMFKPTDMFNPPDIRVMPEKLRNLVFILA